MQYYHANIRIPFHIRHIREQERKRNSCSLEEIRFLPAKSYRKRKNKTQRERERERESKNAVAGFALKADIRHYFETIDQKILLSILQKRINDEELLWLIRTILANHKTQEAGKGMPLGNHTSQFFANVYLGELDNFVKHNLKAKYYLRYVDDFIILEKNRKLLEEYKSEISEFLQRNLKLELHPQKSAIIPLRRGVTLLGFRAFCHFRLLKKSNQKRIKKRLQKFKRKLARGEISREHVLLSMAGWEGYAKMASTYKLRKRIWEEAEKMLKETSGETAVQSI